MGLILGGGEASEASPGLTQGRIEELIGYPVRPKPGTKEYDQFLQSSAAARRLMGDLLTDGTMRMIPEKQPSGEIIQTYALADKARAEAHANPKPPTMQAHPQK